MVEPLRQPPLEHPLPAASWPPLCPLCPSRPPPSRATNSRPRDPAASLHLPPSIRPSDLPEAPLYVSCLPRAPPTRHPCDPCALAEAPLYVEPLATSSPLDPPPVFPLKKTLTLALPFPVAVVP
ncbi:vegetative cell wall protein gp1-like [Iris pallida]|uniref:Vegetative cell wall protein gp1-like n=1 Tax=Iris pallida TaxID=29817 RepID=A0AAX6GP53_IRIPA|nr:vegetative cell wall protein gp1-like [Iris pallida]KAJ6830071.1 vegetative cell wall protein gp1-like [Iris pallida]